MPELTPAEEKELLRQHIARWRLAAPELAALRQRELENTDTQTAIRQLFGNSTLVLESPRLPHSGLVDQQAWFSRLRHSGPRQP